ncbi:Fungal Zn(2)-Cys(6) binuclear cluster domain [Ceratobasidium sp. AG-Ba]|nr:Fungal Zn(2)-Cys(6) binuclear cluster domain [Ceratobasidium sp. AG-Ba]
MINVHTSIQCEWSTEADARRPVTKQLIDNLQARIQSLEDEIRQIGGSSTRATLGQSLSPLASTTDVQPLHQRDPTAGYVVPKDTDQRLGPFVDIVGTNHPSSQPSHHPDTPIYRYIFCIDTTVSAIQQPSDDVRLSLKCDWSRYLPQLPTVPLTRLEHDTLLLRCFKYGTSWLFGFVPELFLRDMLLSLTTSESMEAPRPRPCFQHYSPLLHCSMIAFASAFSDDPNIRDPTTRAKFAVHAKEWLDAGFDQPTASLLPALMLLAEYHCGVGEKETGYMYMGGLVSLTHHNFVDHKLAS